MNEDYLRIVTQTHEEATRAAEQAAEQFFVEKLGGRDQLMCGFAWVDIYNVRSNSKLGKALQAVGFQKSYTKTLQLWNPSRFPCQNVDTLLAGARAYAEVLTKHGFNAHAGSRLD
jgi:hypothetical protein